jgi:hypothetical protein
MKSKQLATFGIVAWFLSVASSAQNLAGRYTAPTVLVLVAAFAMLVFTIMAVVRLWKTQKLTAVLFLILSIVSLVYVSAPVKIIAFIFFIWAISLLFAMGKYEDIAKKLDANKVIRDAIVMGVADKYIEEENLTNDDFGLQLLGRSLNWAVPDLGYNFDNDLNKVENEGLKKRLKENEDQIFNKGLSILNSDALLERLIAFYITHEIYLIDALSVKNGAEIYPGIIRMKKYLFQMTEKEPNIQSPDFRTDYKNLFIKFNESYGKYGKTLKRETIDSLFSLI